MEADNLRNEFKIVLKSIETLFESLLTDKGIHSASVLLQALRFLAVGNNPNSTTDNREELENVNTHNNKSKQFIDPALFNFLKHVDKKTLDLLDNQGRVTWRVERTGAGWIFGKRKGKIINDYMASAKGVCIFLFISNMLGVLGVLGMLEILVSQEVAFICWFLTGIVATLSYMSCMNDFAIVRQLITQPVFVVRAIFILGWSISLIVVTNSQLSALGVALFGPFAVTSFCLVDAANYNFRKMAMWIFVALTLFQTFLLTILNIGLVPSQVDPISVRITFGTIGGISKYAIEISWYGIHNQFGTSLIAFYFAESLYRWKHRRRGELSTMGILLQGVDGINIMNTTSDFSTSLNENVTVIVG
jgi:hypothetical protein